MIAPSRFLSLALLAVMTLVLDVGMAQVTPNNYSAAVSGYIYDYGGVGGGTRHLAVGEDWEFGDNCGEDSCIRAHISHTAATIAVSLTCNTGQNYIWSALRLTAGATGAVLRYDYTTLDYASVEVDSITISPLQSFYVAPNQTVDVYLESYGSGKGSLQVDLEAGDVANVYAETDLQR